MAKDLPYFKFIISEWNDGDITLCSMEAQGLFINLCSLYWSQEGELSITKAKRRYIGCNTTVWDELINDRIIKVDGDDIIINFLDEQFRERAKLSKTNSANVAKRWQKEAKDTTVLPSHNGGNGSVYNIEEKREEEKRKEKKVFSKKFSIDNYKSGEQAFEEIKNDELFIQKVLMAVHSGGYKACTAFTLMKGIRHFISQQSAMPGFSERTRAEVKTHLINWANAKTLNEYV